MRTTHLHFTLLFLFFISHVLSSYSNPHENSPDAIFEEIKARHEACPWLGPCYISPKVEFRITKNDLPGAAICAIIELNDVVVSVLCSRLFDRPTLDALMTDKAELIRQLLNKMDNIDRVGHYGRTLLNTASACERSDIVQMLLDKNCDVYSRDKGGRTALMGAIESENVQIVKMLLNKMDNVDQADFRGFTAMHDAARLGLYRIVKLLLTKTNLDYVNNMPTATPSHLARRYGYGDVAQLIDSWSK